MINLDIKFNKEIETMTKSEKMRLENYHQTINSATEQAMQEIWDQATNGEGTLQKDMVTAEHAVQVIRNLDFKMIKSLVPAYPYHEDGKKVFPYGYQSKEEVEKELAREEAGLLAFSKSRSKEEAEKEFSGT